MWFDLEKVDMPLLQKSFLLKSASLTSALALAVPALGQSSHGGHAKESATSTAAPNPSVTAPPSGPSPVTGFESAFQNYRSFSEEPLKSWSEANEQVGEIGGWRAYAREAQEPATSGTSANTTPGAPAAGHDSGSHGSHK